MNQCYSISLPKKETSLDDDNIWIVKFNVRVSLLQSCEAQCGHKERDCPFLGRRREMSLKWVFFGKEKSPSVFQNRCEQLCNSTACVSSLCLILLGSVSCFSQAAFLQDKLIREQKIMLFSHPSPLRTWWDLKSIIEDGFCRAVLEGGFSTCQDLGWVDESLQAHMSSFVSCVRMASVLPLAIIMKLTWD